MKRKLLSFLGLCIFSATLLGGSVHDCFCQDELQQHDDDSRSERDDEDFVAVITGEHETKWADGMRPMPPDAAMEAGDRLSLTEGLIEITFDDGAVVILEGPSEFVIDSPGAGTLEVGKLSARIPRQAVGFSIDIPTGRIVDLGTEFCVEVVPMGAVEVHVLRGRVVLLLTLPDDGHGKPMFIAEGEAIRVSPNEGRVDRIASEPGRFAHDIAPDSPPAPADDEDR